MRIVCDRYIPFLLEAVRIEWSEAEIVPLKPEEIDNSAVRDADVLVVRTRTQVNEQLLAGSKVRLVCTATIGYDHIDTAWCEAHGIRWVSCPGCNAQAVCDYIEEVLNESSNLQIFKSSNFRIFESSNPPTIGVVGVGHVGSLVAQMAERKGLNVILNDPPKGIGETLDFIAQNCDIITFHVPLTSPPTPYTVHPTPYTVHLTPYTIHHPPYTVHPTPSTLHRTPYTLHRTPYTVHRTPYTVHRTPSTLHLCDEAFLSKCKPDALIINAARGGVVDERALLRSGHPYVLDTWENEPNIDQQVLQHALLASMHIAGYSWEGKRNASQMCLNAIADTFKLTPIDITEPRYAGIMSQSEIGDSSPGWLSRITEQLKTHLDQFESLRKSYPLR